jgi:hypothetical protein
MDRSPQRLRRTLGRTPGPSRTVKTLLMVVAFVAIAWGVSRFGRTPDLSHVDVAILSGSAQGNYHAIVAKAGDEAKRRHGRIDNLASAGSGENIARLAAAKQGCEAQFALVQDGMPWPSAHTFELIGRLPSSESLVVLGRDADRVRALADLRGMRVGIGPVGSGTEVVARQVIAQIDELGLKTFTQPIVDQLAKLERGELDLGAMVIDRDATLLAQAVRERHLQILDMAGAEALASRLPSARPGIIRAGHYDPVRVLPPTDKRVIDIDTLLIGNGCARESVTQGVIVAMTAVFPDFVRSNRERPNLTGLPTRRASRSLHRPGRPRPRRRARALGHRHHADGALGAARVRVLDAVRRPGAVAPVPAVAARRGARRHRERGREALPGDRDGRRDRGDAAGSGPAGERGAHEDRHADRRPRRAVEAHARAVAVDPGADGPGDGLPLPGAADRGHARRAARVPRAAGRLTRAAVEPGGTGAYIR